MTTMTARALLATLVPSPRLLSKADRASDAPILDVCCDSRLANEYSLFVCIRGAAIDGHRYLPAAYKAGCRAFLVEDASVALPDDATVWLSDDTRRDLALLAAAHYGQPAHGMRLVGITGTKGKTSVAMMCYHILKKNGQAVGYIGTNGVLYCDIQQETNNTTPGPLELHAILSDMKAAGIETVLLEVSSQALWQKRVWGLPFTVCAMTNLYPDHLGGAEHPSMEHYAACKHSLLTDYGAPVIIGNADDDTTPAMMRGVSGKVVLCGIHRAADRCAEQIRHLCVGVRTVTEFICHHAATNTRLSVRLPLIGEHNVQNALFALAITHTLGIPDVKAADALTDITIPGRFELIEHRGALIVIDYAHNGAAPRAALSSLREFHPKRLLCLVGSVGGRTQCRRAELGAVADELADFTYLTADDPGEESVEDICRDMIAAFKPRVLPNYTVIPDRAEAIRAALGELCEGDILLLAGKGDERTIRIGNKNIPHRDRNVVEAYIQTDKLMLS